MKKYILITLTFVLSLAGTKAQQVVLGDANGDGTISIQDVATVTNVLLGKESAKQVNSQEFFIRENQLTGTYKINGEDKLFYKGYEVVDFGNNIYWFATNIGAYSFDQTGTVTNSIEEAEALLPEGCTIPTSANLSTCNLRYDNIDGKQYARFSSKTDSSKFFRVPMTYDIWNSSRDQTGPCTIRPIFVGTIPAQGSGGSSTDTDSNIEQGGNDGELE